MNIFEDLVTYRIPILSTGSHENIVSYYSSWFENEKLYIQMELCDHSLSNNRFSRLFTETEVLHAMHQVNPLNCV